MCSKLMSTVEPEPPERSWASAPCLESGPWRRRFGGMRWRGDSRGVFLGSRELEDRPQRTRGEPITTRVICELFEAELIEVSHRWGLPPEILVMVVATEAGLFRRVGFTGPLTFRWEAHVNVRDVEPRFRGDYSFGPMQTLAGTARRISRKHHLSLDPESTFPALRENPNLAPEDLPGYRPEISLDIGAAVIADGLPRTGLDPILIAANYNAGGLYDASSSQSRFHNRWHLRSYGNHLDRAARWLGDACEVIGELRRRGSSGSGDGES